MRSICITLIAIGIIGCAATEIKLSRSGKSVRVKKSDPSSSCEEIGPVEAVHGNGCGGFGARGSYKGAYNLLRNKAAEMGGNYVRMDSQSQPTMATGQGGCADNRYVILGVVYDCH